MVAVSSSGIDVVRVTPQPPEPLSGCPPAGSLSATNATGGSFTPLQLIVSPEGGKAYVLTSLSQVMVLDVSSGTVTNIPLAGGAFPLSGGITRNAAQVYVGGSDNAVHRIDVASGADVQQISVQFTPNLVAVRPQ
jgi:DNA-binding beta-propeller fold protein YncE